MFVTSRSKDLFLFNYNPPLPLLSFFLLMIPVQNFMLIKDHIETWLGLKINRNDVIRLQSSPKILKSHHEETWLERHHSLAMLKNKQTTK